MSRRIAACLARAVTLATRPMRPYRQAMTRALVAERLAPVIEVGTAGGPLRFACPSGRSLHDPAHLREDEPETIRWLDALEATDVLWDIGANIGAYALYAARSRGARVLAFEPGAASYAALTRNIELNGLADRVDAYCLAFDETSRLDHLHMAATGAGHSMHAFGTDASVGGRIAAAFRQSTLGFAVDDFLRLFAPPPPTHVKLDVDSIEERVLRGAARTLARHTRSVIVEIDGTARAGGGAAIRSLLAGLGFREAEAEAPARRNVVFRREGGP